MWRSNTDGPGINSIYCPRLPTELVRRQVAVIAAASTTSALAAKAATATIPIVFVSGADPVRVGLVSNLARPDGNLTGISFVASELTAKRLELLRELVPGAHLVGVLVNPANAELAETTLKDVEPAARAMGVQIRIFNAITAREIDAAFVSLARERLDARSSSAATRCLLAGGFNSPICQRAMRLP